MGAPVLLVLVQPFGQGGAGLAQIEEEVLGFPKLDFILAADLAAGVDEFDGVQGTATVVALVAAGVLIAAMGAGSLDESVGQILLVDEAVGLKLLVFVDVAVIQMVEEQLLHRVPVVLGVGVGEEIEAEAQGLEGFHKAPVVAGHDLLGRDAFLLGAQHDGRAVGVGAGDHAHLVAAQALVAGVDVGGQISAGHMAEMAVAAGVGPGDADKITLG